MKILTGVIFAFVAVFAVQGFAQTTTVTAGREPGKAGVKTVTKVTGTIVAVDKATRDVTMKGPQGNELVVTAGENIRNFDQIKVGDQVDMEYVTALVLELKKGGGQQLVRTEQAAGVAAKPGTQPAGAVGRQVTVVADVIAVDPATQTITLKGPQRTVDLAIADPEQFKRIAKGDQVEATYTQAVAMAVTPKK